MDELRAAAERVAKYIRKKEPDMLSVGKPMQAFMADVRKVAAAYLAEHPADDAEPVTEDWLLSIGFTRNKIDQVILILESKDLGRAMTYITISPCELCIESDDGGSIWLGERTRGDVRTLCRALGVEMKEGE